MSTQPSVWLALGSLVACGGTASSPTPATVSQQPVQPPPAPIAGDPVDDRTVIDAATPRELIEAMGSDRIVRLTAAEYRLDQLWSEGVGNMAQHGSGYRPPVPPPGTDVVSWSDPYDGWELLIHNVQNLTIVGAHDPPPQILTSPRGSWVLAFSEVSDVDLSNLTIGHTEGGYCLGGVVALREASRVRIDRCDLFGSGTVGVEVTHSQDVTVEHSKIRDCSYQIASVHGSRNVRFVETEFVNNKEFNLVEVDASSAVTIVDSAFRGNRATSSHYPFFQVAEGGSLTVSDTIFEGNEAVVFEDGPLKLERVSYSNNNFP